MELNRSNYFSEEAKLKYLSSTYYKKFDIMHSDGCEAREMAILEGKWKEEPNDALILGSLIHAWNEGEIESFKEEHKELYSTRGETKGQLKSQYKIAEKMIETLENDNLVQQFRNNALKEVIYTGVIGGADFKIQVDLDGHQKGYFADLKTTQDLSKTYWNNQLRIKQSFISYYDYWTQIAIYAEVIRQNLNMDKYIEPYIIAVDKQDIPDHEIIHLGTSWIPKKLEEIAERVPRIMQVRNYVLEPIGCGKCAYCRSQKKAKVIGYEGYLENLGL